MQFFEDVGKVYPGWKNGQKQNGLFLKNLDPTPEDFEEIKTVLPPKRLRQTTISDEIDASNINETENESCEFKY